MVTRILGLVVVCTAMVGCQPERPDTKKPATSKNVREDVGAGDDDENNNKASTSRDDADAEPTTDDTTTKKTKTKTDTDSTDTDADEANEDEASATRTDLSVRVIQRMDSGTVLKARVIDGTWVQLPLPDDGNSGSLAGLCVSGSTTKLEIAFTDVHGVEAKIGSSSVLATGSGSGVVTLAYDDAPSGTPDDNVVEITCGGGLLEVQ